MCWNIQIMPKPFFKCVNLMFVLCDIPDTEQKHKSFCVVFCSNSSCVSLQPYSCRRAGATLTENWMYGLHLHAERRRRPAWEWSKTRVWCHMKGKGRMSLTWKTATSGTTCLGPNNTESTIRIFFPTRQTHPLRFNKNRLFYSVCVN